MKSSLFVVISLIFGALCPSCVTERLAVDPYQLDAVLVGAPEVATAPAASVAAVPSLPLVGLRQLAAAQNLDLGVAVSFKLLSIARYQSLVTSEFNALTSENEMKWETIHPTADHYEWFFADTLLQLARDNKMTVRGHTLVWHNQLPRWVTETTTSRETLLALVAEHSRTIVERYRGRIAKWDVVNEVIDDQKGFRETLFFRLTGTDFIDTAFRAAHEADPDCLLYINDYSVESVNPKSDRLYELCRALLARGVPLHGVGLQAHWDLDDLPSMASVRANIDRFVALGLKVDFTELDIRIKGAPTAARLEKQAAAYRDLFGVVLTTAGTDAITVWGVDDGHSWVPGWQPAYGNALLLDRKYQPKPAYTAVAEALRR